MSWNTPVRLGRGPDGHFVYSVKQPREAIGDAKSLEIPAGHDDPPEDDPRLLQRRELRRGGRPRPRGPGRESLPRDCDDARIKRRAALTLSRQPISHRRVPCPMRMKGRIEVVRLPLESSTQRSTNRGCRL